MRAKRGQWRLQGRERSLRSVAWGYWLALGLGVVAQVTWYVAAAPPLSVARPLPEAPHPRLAKIAALGDPAAAARVTMLWLQSADSQAGGSLPFSELDYGRVRRWLEVVLSLDPTLAHPLLSASRVYAMVRDPVRQRQMLEFVHDAFLDRPNVRWPWLAHAVLVARHSLDDPSLALRYAESLSRHATGPDVPAWARDMGVLLAADLGEVGTAEVLLGGLIASGRLRDSSELWFLRQRLEEAKARASDTGSN